MKKRYINPTILCVEMQDNLMLDLSKIEAKGQTKDETIPKGGADGSEYSRRAARAWRKVKQLFCMGRLK